MHPELKQLYVAFWKSLSADEAFFFLLQESFVYYVLSELPGIR